MIVVSVYLDSAVSPSRDTELARVYIANDGGGTPQFGNYECVSVRGRNKSALDKRVPQRRGRVNKFPRQREHVLNLVTKALLSMGYGK